MGLQFGEKGAPEQRRQNWEFHQHGRTPFPTVTNWHASLADAMRAGKVDGLQSAPGQCDVE